MAIKSFIIQARGRYLATLRNAENKRVVILTPQNSMNASMAGTFKHKTMSNSDVKGQMALCYAASHNATISAMVKFVQGLNTERGMLVAKWRAEGGKDCGWLAIEELDKVIDSQEKILISLEGGMQ